MELTLNGDIVDGDVTEALIEKTILALTGEGDSFAILSKNEMNYMQTSGDPKNGYLLEYQEGSLDEHYSCAEDNIDTYQVISAFHNYLEQNQKWKTDFNWDKEDFSAYENSSSAPISEIVIAVIVIGTALFLLFSNVP